MMSFTSYLTILLLVLTVHLSAVCQKHPLSVGIRLPGQWEYQKATIEYSFGKEVVSGNALNFGLDVLLERSGHPWKVYGGLGYFRNRINIHRQFDHEVFNPFRDSIPIATLTRNYTYYLFRIPTGVKYVLHRDSHQSIDVGVENNFNWSLKRKYDGPRAPSFENKNIYGQASFFGSTVNLLFTYVINTKNTQLSVGPYVRLLNDYKKDFILFENKSENNTHYFDAIGIHLQYSVFPQ
jgi:hypothetical protein